MPTVYAIHAPDADKLQTVIAEMRELGTPTIEVINCGDYYQALEGSHRLAAAHTLEIEPRFVVREQDEMIDIAGYDWFDVAHWAETKYPAGDIAGELFNPRRAIAYKF